MYLVYRPDGSEPQEWWFDPQKLRAQEAEAIEKRTGWDFAEFGSHLLRGSVLARRALLWTFQRQVHHTLRFEDVDFATGEVELEYSKEELQRMRESAADLDGLDQVEREAALRDIDQQIEAAREGPGKAPASSNA